MFELSFSELALIALIALIVIGPERLPGVARTVGKWIGKVQRMAASVRADIDRELQTEELKKMLTEQKAEMEELRNIVDESRASIEGDMQSINAELTPGSPTNRQLKESIQRAIPAGTPRPDSPSQQETDTPAISPPDGGLK